MPRPTEAMSTYFQAASRAPSVRSMATSSTETIVVSSTATQRVAKSFISGTRSIVQPKRLRSA